MSRHISTCSDIFENCMNRNNSYYIESEQVQTCLFENHMNSNNSYHIKSEQV